jgi:photosystem II stability/assembly factor-like uncharacterized protein
MKKISFLICLSFISVFAFSPWTWQNPLPQGNSLMSVHFLDDNTGFTVGDVGTILKTTNGGTSWIALSSGTTQDLYSVYFTNANTGYVVGKGGTILKTINGGSTWLLLSSGTTSELHSIYFTDANIGYAVGGGL